MNRNKLLLAILVPVVVVSLQGCLGAVAVGAGAAAVSANDRRSTGAQVDDESIELRAGRLIGDRYGGRVHVNATSYDGTVLLTGEVPDQAIKDDCEKMALGVPKVRNVVNELQIAGLSSLPARSNDTYITSKVKTRFFDAALFDPLHVKVVTEAGTVYLMGIVTEKEAADAVEVARTTGGVLKVVKVFEYCKPADEVCRPREEPKAKPSKS
ncbi:MAG TPA: BON domain-containing protein [Burkholderiales bacterium]|nr:BON domain-containing protein [Burkholderiales bacterium]